jgi:hypothetical protein
MGTLPRRLGNLTGERIGLPTRGSTKIKRHPAGQATSRCSKVIIGGFLRQSGQSAEPIPKAQLNVSGELGLVTLTCLRANKVDKELPEIRQVRGID